MLEGGGLVSIVIRTIAFIFGLGMVGSNTTLALDSRPAPPSSPATGTATSPSQLGSNSEYAKWVAKAMNGDADTDYTALRASYTKTDNYDPYSADTHALFEAAWQAVKSNDCSVALEKSEAILKVDFTRIVAHAFEHECYSTAGDAARATRELAIARGLAESLLHSGDGKSLETAYVVVTLNEENFVLSSLGIIPKAQSLVNKSGHMYDLMQGTDGKTPGQKGVYFNVDYLFAGLDKQFKHARVR